MTTNHDEAKRLKEHLVGVVERIMTAAGKSNGENHAHVGLAGSSDNGYRLKVGLRSHLPDSLDLPRFIEDTPIEYDVVGEVKALAPSKIEEKFSLIDVPTPEPLEIVKTPLPVKQAALKDTAYKL